VSTIFSLSPSAFLVGLFDVNKEGLQEAGVFVTTVRAFIGGDGEERALHADEDIRERDCGGVIKGRKLGDGLAGSAIWEVVHELGTLGR
jgi:hypothetical protein